MDAEQTVQTFLRTWAAGDTDGAMRYVAEDGVYALHISDEVLAYGGETRGRHKIEAAFRQMREQFEYVLFRPYNFVTDADTVRLRVEHMYRHKKSGEMLTGKFRLVVQVRDGLLVRADEYHDRAMVEAFMRLYGAG